VVARARALPFVLLGFLVVVLVGGGLLLRRGVPPEPLSASAWCLYVSGTPADDLLDLSVSPCGFAEPAAGQRFAGAYADVAAATRAARALGAQSAGYTLAVFNPSDTPALCVWLPEGAGLGVLVRSCVLGRPLGYVLAPIGPLAGPDANEAAAQFLREWRVAVRAEFGAAVTSFLLLAMSVFVLPFVRRARANSPAVPSYRIEEPDGRLPNLEVPMPNRLSRSPVLFVLVLVLAGSALVITLAGCATLGGAVLAPEVLAAQAVTAHEEGDDERALQLFESLARRVDDPALQKAVAQVLFRLRARLGRGAQAAETLNAQQENAR